MKGKKDPKEVRRVKATLRRMKDMSENYNSYSKKQESDFAGMQYEKNRK